MTMNQAWGRLFDELDIHASLEYPGRFDLTADQIKSITGKEPRNMSKWDTRDSRPEVLRNACVTILPTSRQGYALVKGDGYFDLPAAEPAIYHSPERLEAFKTLFWREHLTKESAAIDIVAISSILKRFTGEDELTLTIRGRSGTPAFDFDFRGDGRTHRIQVDRAQVEVDAGYEGSNVWLVEAKIGQPEDFLVRQLFYPWRLWQVATRKPVIPIFLTYTNKTFGLFRYRFDDQNLYQSINLVESRWFTFDEPEGIPTPPNLFDNSPTFTPDEGIPFPQADTLGTVIATAELCATEENTSSDISAALNFDVRQGSYYAAAAEWLDLIKRVGARRELTTRGKDFVAASRPQRFVILFKVIAGTPVFREAIRRKLEGISLSTEEIAEMILEKGYAKGTTPRRRAKTVEAWLEWLWREHQNLSRETK